MHNITDYKCVSRTLLSKMHFFLHDKVKLGNLMVLVNSVPSVPSVLAIQDTKQAIHLPYL